MFAVGLTVVGPKRYCEMASAAAGVQFWDQNLTVVGTLVSVRHRVPLFRDIADRVFDALRTTERSGGEPLLDYVVTESGGRYFAARPNCELASSSNLGELLHRLEKDITIEVQRVRRDLLFLHAAAVDLNGRAWLLAADSGHGKSTTTFGLTQLGFGYLSDELSPVDLGSIEVQPYPRALSLKSLPPSPYTLPPGMIDLGRTIHVPVRLLASPTVTQARRIGGVFLLRYSPEFGSPGVRALSAAEAAARIYVTTLNALAHDGAGLAAVSHLAQRVPCYELNAAGLAETCELVKDVVSRLHSC